MLSLCYTKDLQSLRNTIIASLKYFSPIANWKNADLRFRLLISLTSLSQNLQYRNFGAPAEAGTGIYVPKNRDDHYVKEFDYSNKKKLIKHKNGIIDMDSGFQVNYPKITHVKQPGSLHCKFFKVYRSKNETIIHKKKKSFFSQLCSDMILTMYQNYHKTYSILKHVLLIVVTL